MDWIAKNSSVVTEVKIEHSVMEVCRQVLVVIKSCTLSLQMSPIFFMKKEVIIPAERGGGW